MKRKRQNQSKKLKRKQVTPEHSVSEESTDDFVDTLPAKSQSLMRYDALLTQYLESGMSQQIFLIIRRAASDPCIPSEIKSQPLLQLMLATAKEVQLNEFESIVWALYLKKFVWQDQSLSLVTKLMYAALAAKTYMNEDTEAVQAFLNAKFNKFTENFNSWLVAYRGRMSITPRQMNEAFRELSTGVSLDKSGVVDYNFYVDEILELSHAYVTAEERAILEDLKKSSNCRCKNHSPEDYRCIETQPPPQEQSEYFEPFNFSMINPQSVMSMMPQSMLGNFDSIVNRSSSGPLSSYPFDLNLGIQRD